ncbi:MAG: class I SAM-dependent methyltransferase [Alsobacter sp.]
MSVFEKLPDMRAWARRWGRRPFASVRDVFDGYVDEVPSAQTAVDAVPGWTSALPPEARARAGTVPLFEDGRIAWAIEQAGGVTGKRVLEIGPLEGAHTAMLVRAGAQVDAVEANRLAFLRCLVTKEIMGLAQARFHLGDAVRFLESREDTWDLVVASGVLYHMRDPIRFLELIKARGKAVYLWTHYYDGEAMDEAARSVFDPAPVLREYEGRPIRLWRRTYRVAPADPRFCGGPRDEHYWMEKEGIEQVLEHPQCIKEGDPSVPSLSLIFRSKDAGH